MRPLGHNILIKRDPLPESKIILLEGGSTPPVTGKVLKVGRKVSEIHMNDKVMYRESFSATPVPDHPDLLVMNEDNVLLILNN